MIEMGRHAQGTRAPGHEFVEARGVFVLINCYIQHHSAISAPLHVYTVEKMTINYRRAAISIACGTTIYYYMAILQKQLLLLLEPLKECTCLSYDYCVALCSIIVSNTVYSWSSSTMPIGISL